MLTYLDVRFRLQVEKAGMQVDTDSSAGSAARQSPPRAGKHTTTRRFSLPSKRHLDFGCFQEACKPLLEAACSSSLQTLDAVHEGAYDSPCPMTSPDTPAPVLSKRSKMQREHVCQVRTCRMLPGLAPCTESERQQLSRWLRQQEAAMVAAAQVKVRPMVK